MMRLYIKYFLVFIFIGILAVANNYTVAQNINRTIRNGNELYNNKKFADADKKYTEALLKDKNDKRALYNKASSTYKLNKYDEALNYYNKLPVNKNDKAEQAQVLHNIGNTHLKKNDYESAIKNYKDALKKNPADNDTRYNLAYAQKKQKEENKKDKNKDKEQKEDKKDENKLNDNKEKKEDKPTQNKPNELKKEDAERILQALNRNEKEIQDRKNKKQGKAVNIDVEKDW